MTAVPRENPYAGQGAVLLDIGDDIGALVVRMPASMEGAEVEIRLQDGHHHGPEVAHDHHPHVAVVNRPVQGAQGPSLVFPELVEGRYELCGKGTQDVRLAVDVRGGEVTAATWPAVSED
jgi:hypothetical protein